MAREELSKKLYLPEARKINVSFILLVVCVNSIAMQSVYTFSKVMKPKRD